MNKWFESIPKDLWPIVVTALFIYFSVVLLTRVAGKRSFSKMSSFDFAVTVAIGSIVATVILSKSVSLMQGFVGLVSLYVLQIAVAALRRYDLVQKLVDNRPLLLMRGHEVLEKKLKKYRGS